MGEAGGSTGDGGEHLPDHVAEEEEVETGGDPGQDDEAESEVGAEVCDPDGEERILKLYSSLTHIEHKQTEAAKEDHGEVLPVSNQAMRRLSITPLANKMLSGKYQPEDEKVGVEDSLLNVIEEVDPGHLIEESAVLQGQVEEG